MDKSPNGRNAYLGALAAQDAADPIREESGAVYQCVSQLTPTNIEQVCPVQAVSMVADVCATGPITYQWQRRGGLGSATDWVDVVEGSNSEQGQFLLNAVGASARNLRVDSGMARWPFAEEIPSYEFRCVATASCGSLTTNAAKLIVCPADINCDGVVDGDDVIVYFEAWDTGGLIADFTGDEGVDGDDVIAFFARWDAGC